MTTSRATKQRIYLSPPHLTGRERALVEQAFDSNWISSVGPEIDAFELEFKAAVGASYAVAVTSGTAALHLALRLAGVGPDDDVLISTFTFIASASPIVYLGAHPIFVDSERTSWNMNPDLLASALEARARKGKLPAAVVVAHTYGHSADLDAILATCDRYEVPLVEDAAAALGSLYKGRSPGTFGRLGAYSFNGNKIITTSGGGMLVSEDGALIAHARKLATQAREPAAHYEHTEIGYNYRLSNLLAALGRGQLAALEERVAARRRIFAHYCGALGDVPGIAFMPEPYGYRHSRWLTCITIDPATFGADREAVRLALDAENIESRPLWKPLHLQPVFAGCDYVGGAVAQDLFAHGLSLPSGSALSEEDLTRIVTVIRSCAV